MKKIYYLLLLLFVILSTPSLKCQDWVSWIHMTKDCPTCIKKTVSTFDEQLYGDNTPAILLDNYGSPTLLAIDTIVINKTCMPISMIPIDIYKYKILPGKHYIIGCLRPSSSNSSLNPYYSGPVTIYSSNQVYLEFEAEEGKVYRIGAFEYRKLNKWSLIVVDQADSVVASSIDTEIEYVSKKINSQKSSERINTVNKLDVLYKIRKDEKILNLILSLLSDSDLNVRLHTISILSEILNDTIPFILEKKYHESESDEKLFLNSTLIILKNENFDNELIAESFKSKNYLVRKNTARAIRYLDNNKYNDMLINLLNDKYNDVRYEAVWTLGVLGDVSVIDDLKQFKKQEMNLEVKDRIRQSIKDLKKLDK